MNVSDTSNPGAGGARALPDGVEILAKVMPGCAGVLSKEALAFVARLHREFNPTREALLLRRAERQVEFDAGRLPDFLPQTEGVRRAS